MNLCNNNLGDVKGVLQSKGFVDRNTNLDTLPVGVYDVSDANALIGALYAWGVLVVCKALGGSILQIYVPNSVDTQYGGTRIFWRTRW